MTTWFTSDWHLHHLNIIRYCNRPFLYTDEMNRAIKDKFLERVKEGDTVYFLGDLSFKKGDWFKMNCMSFFRNVPAEMIFLYGNHDKMKQQDYEDMGFKVVTKDPIELYINGTHLLLTHEPTNIDSNEIVNVHGHVHDKWRTTFLGNTKTLGVNVSVEVWDYYPVSLEQIFDEINKAKGYET